MIFFFIIIIYGVKRKEKKKTESTLCVWIGYSEVFTQYRLLVHWMMLALLQFLPNYRFQMLKEPSGKTECSVILFYMNRSCRGDGPDFSLTQLWGRCYLTYGAVILLMYFFLLSVEGGGRDWQMINIWCFAVSQPNFWLLKSPFIYYHWKDCVCLCVCVCVCVRERENQYFHSSNLF